MKITYFKYWMSVNRSRHRHDLRPFLKAFAGITDQPFRESFVSSGENLFLYDIGNDVMLLAITKDKELIKAISGNTMSHDDIAKRLNKNEHIGFASYILIREDYFGMAATIHGPKVKRWADFVNAIFDRVNLNQARFRCAPFETMVSTAEALTFAFKSSIRIGVERSNPLFDAIASWGCGADADQISVEIRPKKRLPMRDTFDAVLRRADEQGIRSLVVRAKEHLEDQLSDFYVVGQGKLSRPVYASTESEICNELIATTSANSELSGYLQEFRNDRAMEDTPIASISRLERGSAWSHIVARRRVGN